MLPSLRSKSIDTVWLIEPCTNHAKLLSMNPSIKDYISTFDVEIQERLQKIRSICTEVFPEAKEDFKWGQPAFSLKRALIVYAGYKNHIGFYPTPEVIEAFKQEIMDYKSAKGSVQFPHNKPFPEGLVRKMILASYKNYLETYAK